MVNREDFIFVDINWGFVLFHLWEGLLSYQAKDDLSIGQVKKQKDEKVVIVPMTNKNMILANRAPYKRYIMEAGNSKEPA